MRPTTYQLDALPGSRKPIYRQIASQIAAAIAEQVPRPGDQLTPYRELAERYAVPDSTTTPRFSCSRLSKPPMRDSPSEAKPRLNLF